MALARCIAVLGTGSDVGKSIAVAGICRALRNRGLRVAPYKAQNMSNNSYVTLDGGEMGRAQVVQAQAAGIEPHTDMNPVLLKPNSDTGSQVVLHGKAIGNVEAADYFRDTGTLLGEANQSLARLREAYDVVVIEGAGSCAEVNLRSRDFVNFETAHAADAAVVLIADIDRGGVFAQLIGTLDVIPPADKARVKGFLINKFRGDATLFDDGIEWIEQRTSLPVLGLIPYYRHIEIDSEDGMPLETVIDPPTGPAPGKIGIACIRLPHISNFTDFNPLIRNPRVAFHYLSKPRDLADYDLLIVPGTKNVRFDLKWLADVGWRKQIEQFAAAQGRVMGICGGYQMLGQQIHDPHGVEGPAGSSAALGLLDVETTLQQSKQLSRSQGIRVGDAAVPVDGYEIHVGETALGPLATPFARLTQRNRAAVEVEDGAVSPDGRIQGTYLHGIFDAPAYRNAFLGALSPAYVTEDAEHAARFKDGEYDKLGAHFEAHVDIDKLLSL